MLLLGLAFALVLVATPVAAVTVTTVPGAPDPGFGPHEQLLAGFDGADAAGVIETSIGAVITAAGSIGGVRAAPAGTGDGVYRSIGGGGSSLFDFSGFAKGRALTSLSLYWGSVDSYNHVDFLDATGAPIASFGGNDLPMANGDQRAALTNLRVFFAFRPDEKVTAVRLRSDGAAFEFDSIAGGTGAVPEPGTWTLMITGFGLLGLAMRRRSRVVAA